MTNGHEFDKQAVYAIRVLGVLDENWQDWFDGFCISRQGGETRLQGQVADQTALLGYLTKIINLSLTLISVERMTEHRP